MRNDLGTLSSYNYLALGYNETSYPLVDYEIITIITLHIQGTGRYMLIIGVIMYSCVRV